MHTAKSDSTRNHTSENIEFRVMPSGQGEWYWELIRDGRHVVMRGVADTEPAACKEAGDAARKANLIP